MLLAVMLITGLLRTEQILAADSEIILENTQTDNEDGYIRLNVSIRADNNIGVYKLKLSYDTDRLQYISGAESELDGVITLTGTGFGKEITYEILLNPISGGKAGITVESAYIFEAGTDERAYNIEELPSIGIDIEGEDTVGTDFDKNSEIHFFGALEDGSMLLRIVDIADYEIKSRLWDYKTVTDTYNGDTFTFLTDNMANIRVLLALDDDNNVILYAYRPDKGRYYNVSEMNINGEAYYIMTSDACLSMPENMTDEEKNDITIFYGVNEEGEGSYYRYSTSGELIQWLPTADTQNKTKPGTAGNIAVAAVITVCIAGFTALILLLYRKRRNYGHQKQIDLFNGRFEDKKQYFFVVRELTAREIKRKYARSYLGILWSVLNPLLTMAVMSFIFSYMFKRSIDNYALYYLTGNIFWTLFSVATNSAMTALVDNKMLLVKAKLPKQTFVLSRVYTSLVNFGYTCIAYLFMLLVFRIRPSWTMLLFIPDVLLALLFATGIGYLLSILYVFFADIKYLYSVALTLLLYMSAIFYPVSSLPPVVKNVIGFNPIYLSIYIARESVIYNHVPHYSAWLKLLAAAVISMGLGLLVFRKKENDVMQRI